MSTRTRTYRLHRFFVSCALAFAMGAAGAQTASEHTASKQAAPEQATTEQAATAYVAASERFTAKASASPDAPLLKDPDTRALLEALSDRRVLDARTFTTADIPMLSDVCQRATAAFMAYGMHNVRERLQAETDPARIYTVMQQQMGMNFLLYEDEITVLMPFAIHCGARMMQVLDPFVAGLKPEEFTPVRQRGLEQARRGFQQMYIGMITAGVNPANRLRLLQASAEDAAIYASTLRPNERAEVATAARKELAGAHESLQPSLRAIADAMSSTDCTGLCLR